MSLLQKLLPQKHTYKVTLTVKYYNFNQYETFVTHVESRKSAKRLQSTYEKLFMNGNCVNIGGDNPVMFNMYKLSSVVVEISEE